MSAKHEYRAAKARESAGGERRASLSPEAQEVLQSKTDCFHLFIMRALTHNKKLSPDKRLCTSRSFRHEQYKLLLLCIYCVIK